MTSSETTFNDEELIARLRMIHEWKIGKSSAVIAYEIADAMLEARK